METPLPVILLFISLSVTFTKAYNNNPEQIHIAFTGFPSERIINYVTPSPYEKPETVAAYGTGAYKLDKKAYGDSFVFPGPGRNFTIHNVKLTGLESNTRYYYQVGNPDNGSSEIFSFSTKDGNLIFAVYGDLGYRNAVSLDRLKTEAKSGEYDAIIHVGDFAYDMNKKKGKVGDDFMNAIQPIASRVPYMVLPGNHEREDNFTQYLNRFSNMELGVGQTSGSQTSLWWSMDIGLIHFVCFDTEVHSFYPDEGQIQRQLNWLEADLIKANKQRVKTPWIVSLAHKGFFMEKTNFSHFGPLLHKYGVDLHLCGHRHNYQRLYPTYNGKVDQQRKHKYLNPAYMTTIVAGSAGAREKLSHSTAPKEMMAKYLKRYGYGHLQAINRTHLYWKWESTHYKKRSVLQDHLWLVQENHGRRDRPVQVYQEENIKQLINDIIEEYENDIGTASIC